MDELVVQGEIGSHIFTLRGKEVMLDRDLAELYQVKARRLREQVKRNSKRFPDDFMFQLNESEVETMWCRKMRYHQNNILVVHCHTFLQNKVYICWQQF